MKKALILLALLVFISCKKEQNISSDEEQKTTQKPSLELGKTLFEENNCTACHKVDQKVVGPSLQDIAKIYKEKKGNLISCLKEEAEPIVDETMYETMKINLQVTKKMNDSDLKSLELYILNQAK